MAAVGRIGRALRRVAAPAKKAVAGTGSAAAEAPAKKAAAKKAPAKKEPAKKAPAKKEPAKKAPAKKEPAKKAPAKKAPAKKAPAKKAPAKKAPAKKEPAKKAPATKITSPSAPSGGVGSAPAEATPTNGGVRSEWTRAELDAIRTQLTDELAEMHNAYDVSMHDLDELQRSSTDGAGDDQADAGSKTFEREQEQSIAANRFDLLTQMEHAVARIDAKTYGFCERCGKPIPKARLQAFPAATLDVGCKAREERR